MEANKDGGTSVGFTVQGQNTNHKIVVTAQCARCKKKKEYIMPINYTPYCDVCFLSPMFVKKIKTYVNER